MALIDGKQLREQSTSLNKLSGTGIVTFTQSSSMIFSSGSVLRQAIENITDGQDVVNKTYVDSVAQGLHIKESVQVITTDPITLIGTYSVDGYTLQIGDRVLVNAQDYLNATFSNGIYVVEVGNWSRATDADGVSVLPSGEVQLGDFVFVVSGQVYSGTGWVLNVSDSTDFNILVGTESQRWTQFSSAGVLQAGYGLVQIGNDINVNTGPGLTVSGGQVVIDSTGVTASNYGSDDSVAKFTVNGQGQITSAESILIEISSNQVNDFTVASETAIFDDANFLDGTTIEFIVNTGNGVVAEVFSSSLDPSHLNILNSASASQGWKLAYNNTNQFEWLDPSEGDISEVVAGNGLNGGGVSGVVTLDVNVANGIEINGNNVEIASSAAGNGLTFSSGVFDIVWGGTATGTTFSNNSLSVVVDNSSIQINSSGELSVVSGATQPVYELFSGDTTTGNDSSVTGVTLSNTPSAYSRVQIFVNGLLQRLGDGNTLQDCYFGTSGNAKSLANFTTGDQFYWNGTNAGFELSNSDKIDIVYEV